MSSQASLNLTGPLVWEESENWGKTSACGRFSVRHQTVNGKEEFVLWRRGADGRVIPKQLGVFDTFEAAAVEAEEHKYRDPPKRNGIYDWRPRWGK